MESNQERVDSLRRDRTLDDEDFLALLALQDPAAEAYLYSQAREVQEAVYGRDVYLRGLIEFTNYCRNDCYYCGIRAGNANCERYRMTEEEILFCCDRGYEMSFRTFVLQGGEDPYFTDERMCHLISAIKQAHPDCALTLSIGERSRESYQAMFDAGADRFLLRQETSDPAHYRFLHPAKLSLENRQRCLWDLKEIGYQVGCGFMVGSPGQTPDMVLKDLRFMEEFQPQMIGIGPFVPHKETRFKDEPAGSLEETLHLIAIFRLMFPHALIPATTALGTIDPIGREKGILAGANVIMPNLSPAEVREKYLLYNGQVSAAPGAEDVSKEWEQRLEKIGYHVAVSRGDYH